jgi:single-strand DNA-binding protein
LQTRKWEQEGQTRYTTEIIARDIQFLDSRGSANTSSQEGAATTNEEPAPDVPESGIDDDDIPF